MKIICAGYPKTGSKSCSGALRVLGFKVADWLESAEFLGSTWRVGVLKNVYRTVMVHDSCPYLQF